MPVHVGDQGVVLATLHPTGVVRIGDERAHARTVMGILDPGVSIVVVGWDSFGLIVRPASDIPDRVRIANFGEPCPSFNDQIAEREEAAEQVRKEATPLRAEHFERALVIVPAMVLIAGAGWWWAGIPGIAIGAMALVLIGALFLLWMLVGS